MFNLYTAISKGEHQICNGGIMRDITSYCEKKGQRFLTHQWAKKSGECIIDVFEVKGDKRSHISQFTKEMKDDKSFVTTLFNHTKGKGNIKSVLKVNPDPKTFSLTLFETDSKGKIKSVGDFISNFQGQINKVKEGVTCFGFFNNLNPKPGCGIDYHVKAFCENWRNNKFGKFVTQIPDIGKKL